jgi:hypothetical protein
MENKFKIDGGYVWVGCFLLLLFFCFQLSAQNDRVAGNSGGSIEFNYPRLITDTGNKFDKKPLISEIDPINDLIVFKDVSTGERREASIKELTESSTLLHMSGVVRFDRPSSTWELLDDASHAHENIVDVISSPNGNGFTITYNNDHVGQMIYSTIIPDDVLIQKNLQAGTSGGLTQTNVIIYAQNALVGYIRYDAGDWQYVSEFSTINIIDSMTWNAGELTLHHSSSPIQTKFFGVQLTPFDSSIIPINSGTGPNNTNIRFFDLVTNSFVTTENTNMKFFISHPGACLVSNQAISQLNTGQMNFWFKALIEGSFDQ